MSNASDRQDSPVSTLPRGKACGNCRRRKVKCDGARPICDACSRSLGSFSDCEYAESGRSQTQIMEETISLIETRIRELENPESLNRSVTLQDPYPLTGSGSGPSVSVSPSDMSIEAFLSGMTWNQPSAYDAVGGVAHSSPIPATMGPNEPRGVSSIGLRQEEPPAAVMQALVHTFAHHSTEIGAFLNIPRFLEEVDDPDVDARPIPALMVAAYLWGIHISNSAECNAYEELYLARAVDQAGQSLPLDRPRKVLQKIQAEILLAYYFFSKGRNVEGRYHASIAVGLILGSQLHKYGGSEQDRGICATIWTPTTDPIDQGERIDAVWAAVILSNTWTAVLSAPSDIPFNSPGFTIDTPWPLDTYGDMAMPLPLSKGTIQKFLREPAVAEGGSNKAFLAKAAVLLERSSYLHSQYRPDAPENETAGLKNSIAILDNVIDGYLASGLPRSEEASNKPSDIMNITLGYTIVYAARIKLQSIHVLGGSDVTSRKKTLQAADAIVEIINQSGVQDAEFVNPIFGHLWTIGALAYVAEIERMRAGDSVGETDVTEISLGENVDGLVKLVSKFADRFHWKGLLETIEGARAQSLAA